MPCIHWILCHLTAYFPQLKSDLHHGKRFSDLDELRTESDRSLKRHGLVISTENVFNNTGNAYSTRESILRNCAVHRTDDVILL